MNNTRLLKDINNVKRDFDLIIDSLIAEIEGLENDKDNMQDEINSLNEIIEEQRETIDYLS